LLQFSARPLLLLCTTVLTLSFAFCLAYAVYILVQIYQGKPLIPGWLSVMFMITFWSGTLALIQFLIALYIDRIFDEVKRRPIYIVREIIESPRSQDRATGYWSQSR
jgi:predicted PurR-regulated permease PerM